MQAERTTPKPTRSLLAFVFAWIGLIALDFALRAATAPPAAAPIDAPEHEFSAARALRFHERVFDARAPHPLGSAEHARVRERLLRELQELGVDPVVEEHEVLRATTLARVRNVVAARGSMRAGGAILLCVHYDSVGAGPGAADDGAGVAALLEVLRALRADSLGRPVLFLFDDGEESGLLGARAFLESSAFRKDVAVVVNVEARGTRGPSRMFETSAGNAELVEQCGALPHPSASSISYEVYRRMPNDTDLTEFKAAGIPGVNFAFVGGGRRYHTPLDDRAHLDLDTLQHHGENVLALTRSLAAHAGDFAAPGRRGDAVYTDLAGLVLVRWPAALAPWIAVLLVLALLLHARRAIRAGAARSTELARGACIGVGVLLLAAACAWCADAIVTRGRNGVYPWPPPDFVPRASVLLAAAAGLAWSAVLVFPRSGARARALGLGLALAQGVAGVLVAVIVPGASYAIALPLLAAVVLGFTRPARALAAMVVVGGVAWLPFFAGIEEVFELRTRSVPAGIGIAVGWAWFAAPIALLLASTTVRARVLFALAASGCVISVAIATRALPERSEEEPEPVFLAYVERVDDPTAFACVRSYGVGAVGPNAIETWLDERGFARERPAVWWPRGSFARWLAVPRLGLVPPTVVVAEDASFRMEEYSFAAKERAVELTIASTRGARALVPELGTRARIRALRTAAGERTRIDRRSTFHVLGFERDEPVTLLLAIDGAEEIELGVLDVAAAEEEPLDELLHALPEGFAPIGEGVVTIAERRVRL